MKYRIFFVVLREARGAMVRVWLIANVACCVHVTEMNDIYLSISIHVAACLRLRIPLGAGFPEIFREILCFSPLNLGTLFFDVVSMGKASHPQVLHLTQVTMSTW